ncbi:MAG: hypothetical protein U1F60_05860 [Planctomycetota bacterium]
MTPRAENTLAERIRRTFAILGYTLVIFCGIGGACYLTIEVWKLEGALQNVVIGALVLPLVGLVLWRLRRWPTLDGFGPSEQQRQEIEAAAERFAAKRRAEIAQRTAELTADPRRAPFAALAQQGFLIDDAEIERRLARKQALEAVPHRAPFAASVFEFHPPSDAQIDYLADPNAVATCVHLQPVERALRADLVPVQLVRDQAVRTNLRLADDVAARFRLAASVVLREEVIDPRDGCLEQWLFCSACRSAVEANAYGQPWPAGSALT